MKIINYYNNETRTSMKLTSAQETAMRFLCDSHGFKRLQDYIYHVMDLGLTKNKGISMAVKDYMIEELIYAVKKIS